jgi:hypothetical protein
MAVTNLDTLEVKVLKVAGVTVDENTLATNDLTATAVEINQALDGIGAEVTAANLTATERRLAGRAAVNVAVDKALTIADCGVVQVVTVDAKVVSLPPTAVGLEFEIENGGADGAVLVTVSPDAADQIAGAGLAAADDKDILNTKVTAKKGDRVRLVANGAAGWVLVEKVGAWARQA